MTQHLTCWCVGVAHPVSETVGHSPVAGQNGPLFYLKATVINFVLILIHFWFIFNSTVINFVSIFDPFLIHFQLNQPFPKITFFNSTTLLNFASILKMNAMSDSAPAGNADLAILSIPDISSWSWSCILHDPDPDPAFFPPFLLVLPSCWSPHTWFSMSLKSRRSHRHFIQSSSQSFNITWHLSGLRVIPPGWSILGRPWQQQWI